MRTLAAIATLALWVATAVAAFVPAVPGRVHLTLLAASISMSFWVIVSATARHALAYERGFDLALRGAIQEVHNIMGDADKRVAHEMREVI